MESRGNSIKFTIFIIFLLAVGIGGYIGMMNVLKNGESIWDKAPSDDETPDLRLDKTKDYVYYTNEEEILEDSGAYYRDIHINLSSGKLTSETLNNEMAEIRRSIIRVHEVTLDPNVEYTENEEGIYSMDIREYQEYEYEQYVSILVEDYKYDILNLQTPADIKAYVFDKYEDNLISSAELLEKYDLTLDDVKEKIKTKLTSDESTVEGIKIEETVNVLNYAVYINEIGKLEVTFLVKSTNGNYYDNIELS